MKANKKAKLAAKAAKEVCCDVCGTPLSAEDYISCRDCGADLGSDVRYVLTDIVQQVDWMDSSAPTTIVEDVLGNEQFCSEVEALKHLTRESPYLSARSMRSSIRPVEHCMCCGDLVETHLPHRATTLTTETGPEHAITILNGAVVARFCTTCKPLERSSGSLNTRLNASTAVLLLDWDSLTLFPNQDDQY